MVKEGKLPLSLTKKINHLYIPSYDILIESNYFKKAVSKWCCRRNFFGMQMRLMSCILRYILLLFYEWNYVINYDNHNAITSLETQYGKENKLWKLIMLNFTLNQYYIMVWYK